MADEVVTPDTDDLDNDLDTDNSSDTNSEWTPPTREEWEAQQEKLKKANDKQKNLRLAAKAADNKENADISELETQAEAKYKPLFVNNAAKAALLEAGAKRVTPRLLAMIDSSDLDIDFTTGDIDGLEDQINGIREDFPELFKSDDDEVVGKTRTPRLETADKKANARKKTPSEIQAEGLLGR